MEIILPDNQREKHDLFKIFAWRDRSGEPPNPRDPIVQ